MGVCSTHLQQLLLFRHLVLLLPQECSLPVWEDLILDVLLPWIWMGKYVYELWQDGAYMI